MAQQQEQPKPHSIDTQADDEETEELEVESVHQTTRPDVANTWWPRNP